MNYRNIFLASFVYGKLSLPKALSSSRKITVQNDTKIELFFSPKVTLKFCFLSFQHFLLHLLKLWFLLKEALPKYVCNFWGRLSIILQNWKNSCNGKTVEVTEATYLIPAKRCDSLRLNEELNAPLYIWGFLIIETLLKDNCGEDLSISRTKGLTLKLEAVFPRRTTPSEIAMRCKF